MSHTDEMLKLWFEENVMPKDQSGNYAEDLVASFRDYFSVRLRDVLPPHPISKNLELLRNEENRTVLVPEDQTEDVPWRHIEGAVQEKPHDPTYGRIDKDIQDQVEGMNPRSLGQRVAMENTIQNKRNRRLGKKEV